MFLPGPVRLIGKLTRRQELWCRRSGRVLAPQQRIDVDAAIGAQTLDAAWQLHLDNEIGSLETGKYADLTVLSADPRTTAPDQLREIQVEATTSWAGKRTGALSTDYPQTRRVAGISAFPVASGTTPSTW